MRLGLIIAGLIIAALGLGVVSGKLEYKKTDTLLQIGELKAQVKHDEAVPQWLGVLALVVGGGLVLAGALRKG